MKNRWTGWRDSLLAKVALLFVLWLVLCIPLAQIRGLIAERGASQQAAAEELADTHVGPQTLAGPYLLVPYVERWREPVRDARGRITGQAEHRRQAVHAVFPQTLALTGTLTPEERYRGIYKVPFYRLAGRAQGRFAPFDVAALPRQVAGSRLEPGVPVLVLSLSDLRGLDGAPRLTLGDTAPVFERGLPDVLATHPLAAGSVQAALGDAALAAWRQGQALPFALDIALTGQRQLAVAPLGEETTARFTSSWAHPSFGGRFLAAERTVGDTGFDARWRISALTTQARAQMRAALLEEGASRGAPLAALDTFEVAMAQPVNVYAMAERAAKYGGLFIGLVLMAAFMVELFRHLRLHPVQYGLVGLSIAVFFLLLVALSEKTGFALAYAGAAGASVALLAAYFSAVLGGWRRAGALAGYVAVLYAALYGLLASERHALLLGALLVFGMLAVLMLATRHVNWWQLGAPSAPPMPPTSPGRQARAACPPA